MKSFQLQGLALAALLALAGTGSAQAARLVLTGQGTAVDLVEQSAEVDGTPQGRSITGALVDASGADMLLLTDAQVFGPNALALSTQEDGHSHLLAVDATGATTDLSVDASHFWTASGLGTVSAYSLTQSLSLDGLSLSVAADAGETAGQFVTVSFSGLAQALLSGAADTNDLGLTLDVVQGATTLASYNGLWTGSASEAVNFSFTAQIGDSFTVLLSAYNAAGLNAARAINGSTEFSSAVNLQGSFAVTPVPEPGTYGLALAGLMVAAVVARRRA